MAKRIRLLLILVLAGHVVLSVLGIRWGLPTARWNTCLFGDGAPWEGARILRLAGGAWSDSAVGADVDVDPLRASPTEPILLNATEADQARLYLRYRLYTHQPDEMIVMRALGGMKPGEGRLDPRLYQYGGLFIYPVGALLKLCGAAGLIDVRGDVAFYLDHPDEFGKFYVVARAYSAAWGLLAALAAFGIARRLAGEAAGLGAAALIVIMPAVVCMAHEGKPHLAGAALMLTAVWLAMRCFLYPGPPSAGDSSAPVAGKTREDRTATRAWWAMCASCGAAGGMVISSVPVCVLIPLGAYLRTRVTCGAGAAIPRLSPDLRRFPCSRWLATCAGGGLVAVLVYVLTNPYVLINLFMNRAVLASNFGNSLAMYEVARVGEGFLRVVELTAEGAGLPVAIVGALGWVAWVRDRRSDAAPLLLVGALLLVQFILIGAGKPAEYGRFGVFADAALAIGAACLVARLGRVRSPVRLTSLILTVVLGAGTGRGGLGYLLNFRRDETAGNTRWIAAAVLRDDRADEASRSPTLAVLRAPAPYGCPPLDFAGCPILLYADKEAWQRDLGRGPSVLIEMVDHPNGAERGAAGALTFAFGSTPISWANKPVRLTWRSGAGAPEVNDPPAP